MRRANALLAGFLKEEFLWKKTGLAAVVEGSDRFLESFPALLMKGKACRCSCFLGLRRKREAIEKTQFGGRFAKSIGGPGHFAYLLGGHFAKLFAGGHFLKISQP